MIHVSSLKVVKVRLILMDHTPSGISHLKIVPIGPTDKRVGTN